MSTTGKVLCKRLHLSTPANFGFSDIRAELDYDDNGIGKYEDWVNLPNGITDDLARREVQTSTNTDILCYSLQINLRRTLNRTHTFIYGTEKINRRYHGGPREMILELRGFRDTVRKFQQAPELGTWEDGDAPSKDINVARVRGKYYGALYVITRPFLQHAMYNMTPHQVDLIEPKDIDLQRLSEELPQLQLERKDIDYQSDPVYTNRVLEAARLCVEAAMHSTVAFDGLGLETRFILTNIHGTALA